MKNLSKLIALITSVIFISSAAHSVELKFGHVGKPGSLFAASVENFAKIANKKLGSKGKVTVFGSSQLGKDKQGMQKLKLGTVDMWLPSSVMASIHAFLLSKNLIHLIGQIDLFALDLTVCSSAS